MAYRERTDQERPQWDADDDAPPPVWQERNAARGQREADHDEPGPELPVWQANSAADWDAAIRGVDDQPTRTRSQRSAASHRSSSRSVEWPNLRDSLRGSGSTATGDGQARRSPHARRTVPQREPMTDLRNDRPGRSSYQLPIDRNDDEFPPDELVPAYPVGPTNRPYASRTRPRRARSTSPRANVQVPPALAALFAAQDRVVLATAGLSAFSLLLMAATVSSRSGSLPNWIVLHLDAAGRPDVWGSAATAWRLPLTSAMLTIASLVAAAFIGRRDVFAAKFIVAASLLVHVVAWIGLVRLLW